MPDTAGALKRARVRADLDHTRAETRAELLPFGDGYLDDDRPDFHGTNIGLQRHADGHQPPCAELLDELLAAGLAERRNTRPGGDQPWLTTPPSTPTPTTLLPSA